ncbi:MAG: hypothetical protein AB7O24_00230 [Kofleriaceae bacterium]
MTEPSTLEARITAAGPRLTERVLGEMYEDPFWSERFGDRGRRHATQDGDFHIRYLVEALASNDDEVFTKYARWLREVLVPRGMCSRHLAENYERLATAIDQEAWADRARAVAILRAGARALLHVDGDAAAIDANRGDLAQAAASSLSAPGDAGQLEQHLSYLADSLWQGNRALFASYIAFTSQSMQRRQLPLQLLRAHLEALSNVIETQLRVSHAPKAYLATAQEGIA